MGVKKKYDYAEVKSAIDMANNHYYRQLLHVWSNVSVQDWGKKSIPADPTNPLAYRGKGNDVGHSFRHNEPTKEAGKSTYEDEYEMVMCTRELLNSSVGQAELEALDKANPSGMDDVMANRRFKNKIVGVYYGFPTGSTTKQRIASATCVIMKLAENTLWIHTTYPDKFQTGGGAP